MTAVAMVFVIVYALIASDRVNKTLAALCGAAILVAVGVLVSDDVFYSPQTGVDWDVIFLLLGMMIIVSVLRQTGVFEYIAVWAAKRAKGSPLSVMVLVVVITAFASALLDNVSVSAGIGCHRQHSLRRDDDAYRQRTDRHHGPSGPSRCAVVGAGARR